MRLFKQTPEDYYNAPTPSSRRSSAAPSPWSWASCGSSPSSCGAGRSRTPTCCLSARKAAAAWSFATTPDGRALAVETALFFGGRRIRPIFKSEFAKSKIVRWAFSRVGGIPVERGTADMKCLRAAQHALHAARTS
ncbi:MAG: hypothetical protein ACLU0O_07630 [Collinsella sp.]